MYGWGYSPTAAVSLPSPAVRSHSEPPSSSSVSSRGGRLHGTSVSEIATASLLSRVMNSDTGASVLLAT